jgi:hypothetical protein
MNIHGGMSMNTTTATSWTEEPARERGMHRVRANIVAACTARSAPTVEKTLSR